MHRGLTAGLGAVAVWSTVAVVLISPGVSLGTKQLVSDSAFVVCAAIAAVACWWTFTRCTGRTRTAWGLLATTASCWTVGNIWWFYYQLLAPTQPYPSMADVFYLAAVVAAFAGLISLPVAPTRGIERARMIVDGVLAGTLVLFLAAAFGIADVFLAAPEEMLARLVFVSYPAADIGLATVVVVLLLRSRGRVSPWLLVLGAAFVSYSVADSAYGLASARGEFQIGTPLDLGWTGGYLLLAVAAVSADSARDQRPAAEVPRGRRAFSAIGDVLIFAIVSVTIVAGDIPGVPTAVNELADGALILLIGVRQVVLAIENHTLRRDLEARVVDRTEALEELAGRNQHILDAVADGLYGVDRDGRLTFANPAASRMLARDHDDLVGRHAHDLFHGRGWDGTPHPWSECPLYAAVVDGVVTRVADDEYIRADGTLFPVEFTASSLGSPHSDVAAVVAFRDVSERREIDRAKDEFLSTVSHELRTPLTSIRGSLGLIAGGAMGDIPSAADRMIQIAMDSSDRLGRLINDILDLERAEAGTLPMQPRPCPVADLLTTSVEQVRGVADSAEVRLVLEPAGGVVLADPDRVVQTLTNVLGNAVKFSPSGSTVTVSAETVGTEVEFRVRDQGRGIPADRLESIFGRFQQVDSTDSREQNGSGLGLAISRGIVESHGGRIWAQSQVGAGSTFCFTLPAASGSTTGEVVIGDVVPGEARQPKVLVCDNDPEVRALLVTQLERRGYDAVTAARGRDVAGLAVTERPDVVVLELEMDGGTGWETVERLKSQSETRHIPVIVMSALTTSRDGQLAARTDGWILKPVDNSAMGEVVGAAIGRHDAQPTVLLVEDDLGLADVLTTTFNRRGVRVVHAATEREAIEATRSLVPDALVLDLYLPDGDGFAVVAHMRQDPALASIPVVVYSAHEVSGAARDRLRLGETVLFTKGRVSLEDLESRVLDLVGVLADSRQEVGECLPG